MACLLQEAGRAPGSALVGRHAGAALAQIDDKVVRPGYEKAVRALSFVADGMRKEGMGSEQIARTVSGMRRAIGTFGKSKTSPAMSEKIRQRSPGIYDDELGPTVEWLRSQGKSWDDTIESASRLDDWDLKQG